MQFVRKGALVLLAPLFSLLLIALAVDIGFIRVATHPQKTKQILNDSGVYNSAVDQLLDQSKSITSPTGPGNDISLDNDVVKAAANKTITPKFLQTNTEAFIDSVYRWLDGKTQTPDFSLDLKSVKLSFANNVAASVQQRLSSLPACPANANLQNYDAFNATCLPKFITASQAAANVKTNILEGKGFLDQQTLTANDLKSQGTNQSVFQDKLKDLPKAYQRAKESPFILVVLAILSGTAIVTLSSSHKKGLRRVGMTVLGIGIFMLIFAWGLNYGINKQLPKIKTDNAVIQGSIKNIVKELAQEVDKTYWLMGGIYTIVGGAAVVSSIYLFKEGKPPAKPSAPAGPPTPGTTPTTPKPNSSKKKIIVQ